MKTLGKLSNRKLDALDARLKDRLARCRWAPGRGKINAKLIRVSRERLRRLGL